MSMSDVLTRLRRELLAFAAGYPDRWVDETDPCARPLRRLVEAFAEEILGTADVWSAARQLGAELRKRFGYVTPGHVDEASADHLRGLMYVAAEALHGSVSTDFGGGDKLTAEQVAFYAPMTGGTGAMTGRWRSGPTSAVSASSSCSTRWTCPTRFGAM
jgi:hypothetical protein